VERHQYVEGVPDSEYTPGERTMGELAAFCHCCDIISARLWHDKGRSRMAKKIKAKNGKQILRNAAKYLVASRGSGTTYPHTKTLNII